MVVAIQNLCYAAALNSVTSHYMVEHTGESNQASFVVAETRGPVRFLALSHYSSWGLLVAYVESK